MTSPLLTIDGEVEERLELTFADLAAMPADGQVPDVRRFDETRCGGGVTLDSLIQRAKPQPSATHLTLHATSDGFSASLPLGIMGGEGILVYRLDDEPLPVEFGGPVRFVIPNPAACGTAELDACANVKFIDRIELTAGKGRDTRKPG